jgi:serine/threonine-protein kinase RsbT
VGELDFYYPVVIHISDDTHAVVASQQGRKLAALLGFSLVEQTALSTAILEVARNIVKYAEVGDLKLDYQIADEQTEVVITAKDNGPGIEDIELALKDGFSTGKSLGLGLPGARRLMDTFEIVSQVGQGTTITMIKRRKS